LGIDFLRVFSLAADILGSINCLKAETKELEDQYPLSEFQRRELETVKEMFSNFERKGLCRTDWIKHNIDIGEAKPVKQR